MRHRRVLLALAIAAATGCGITVRPRVQPRPFEDGGGAERALLVEYNVRCQECTVEYTAPPRDTRVEEDVARLTRRFQFYEEYQAGSVMIRAVPSDSTWVESIEIRLDDRVVATSIRTADDHEAGQAVTLSTVLVFD